MLTKKPVLDSIYEKVTKARLNLKEKKEIRKVLRKFKKKNNED